ncbi:MAG: hypothetical protein KGD60_01450 [Candidatus Thorarchaeota archaeon]|nr:hypothetical protein [Candidatus Thorarchaeota archaeon]
MTETKKVSEMESDEIKEAVRKTYSKVAKRDAGRGDEPDQTSSSCCGQPATKSQE